MNTQKFRFREWTIYFDPPPIPSRNCDWHYYHDDYDGAPDGNDARAGSEASIEACIEAILEQENERPQ